MCIRDRAESAAMIEKARAAIEAEKKAAISELQGSVAVSYTHLDVYKRQG